MELRHLRYFIAITEELHFGRAAERLGISQPPLSQQIRALEAELGSPLFERTSRRVRLTEAGRLFLPAARQTIAQAEHAAELVRRVRQGEIGELSIGFVASAPFVARIARGLYRFREDNPAVHLILAELPRDEQIAAITEARLDLGFLRSVDAPPLPPGLRVLPVLEEDLIVAMRHDHPLAAAAGPLRMAALAHEPFVLYQRVLGAGFNETFDRLCRDAGFRPRIAQEASGLATLLGLVAAGFGLTLLARSLGALHVDDVVYRTLDEPGAISRLWLVHREDATPASRRFLDHFAHGAATGQ